MGDFRELLIGQSGLSTRAINCLRNGGFVRMGEVEQARGAELLRISELGQTTMREIEAWFAERGPLAGARRNEALQQLSDMRDWAELIARQSAEVSRNIAELEARLAQG